MATPNDALRLLEADLQALSLQASRVEGGVFGGLFSSGSGPLDPDVRDAAEDALTRLRAGHAVACDGERPLSENATTPALRAALLACASPRSDVALAGLRCAQRLVTPTMRADELCALADALGAEETEDEDDDARRESESESDAVAVAKAQTLLRALELDACFDQKDARVAKRVTAACFTLLASANENARLRATNGGVLGSSTASAARESGSKTRGCFDARVVAAEAAAFRACERAFESATRDDDGLKRAFAFGVFRDLCAYAKSDDALYARFALDALTRALEKRPLTANAVYAFESVNGDERGVEAIKTNLCAALVTKTFSDQYLVVSPGPVYRSSRRRRDSADAVAEGRAATKCAVAFLRFAKPRRRDETNVEIPRSKASASSSTSTTSTSASAGRAASSSSKSSFFAFLSPPRVSEDTEDTEDEEDEDDARTPEEKISVEFLGKETETETDFSSADVLVSDAFVDPFAAERTLFLCSFASSLEREMAPWRRSAALDALRTVAGDPELVRLAATRGGAAAFAKKTSDAFGDVTDILARVAEAGVSVRSDVDKSSDTAFAFSAALTMSGLTADTTHTHEATEDAVPLRVAAAFRDASAAARGASLPSFFRDPTDVDETGHVAHAVFLALDGVLTLCSSLETLADESVFLADDALKHDVRHMVERAWVSLESCLSTALARVPGEAATLELCRALQALTRAAAAAGAEEAKDACLGSLCAFSVSGNGALLEENQTQKSAHAFRAMLNAAQSLVDFDALGFRGWFAVLETTRRVEARRVAAAKNVPVAVDEKRARRTYHDATVIDALLASAAALLVSSAALSSDEQSADALEAARGSSARELDDANKNAFSSHPKRNGDGNGDVAAPNVNVRSSSTRPEPDLELRALSRFVDAVLLRVRGGAKAKAQAKAKAHEGKGFDLRARGRAAWRTLEAHFFDALESARPSPEVARRACAQLERAVVGALESIAIGSEDVSLDVAEVLAPLARAKARATCLPARLEAIEAMSALVRERGDLFTKTAGWAAAFDALRAGDEVQEKTSVRENERKKNRNRRRSDDAAVVVAGWSAVAFVVSDVLPASLGADAEEDKKTDGVRDGTDALALARVVPLLSSYASQTDDTRTSLSAVNALWNACDVIARRLEVSGEKTTFRDEKKESSSPLETVLTRAFEALAAVGADRFRPDVRHSGVNTLVNVLAARGATLSPGAWRDATLGVFFPLVFEIRARAAAAGDERVDVSLVSSLTAGRRRDRRDETSDDGSKRDADADASDASSARTSTDDSETTDDDTETGGRLLVHHSRNTAAKQWDETLSVACSAIGKLVHKRGARLLAPETRDAFEPVWIRTCAFMVECITRASPETATAALRAARLAATRFASLSVEGEGSDKPPGGGDAKGRPENSIRSGDAATSAPRQERAPIAASVRAAARTAHKAVLREVYETSTRLATRDHDAKKRVTAKTRLELAKTLAEAFASAPRAAFDFDDVAVVIAVADALARAPEPWPEWYHEDDQASDMSYRDDPRKVKTLQTLGSGYAALQTQRACFDALLSLVPNVSEKCVDAGTYVSVLFLFLSYVSGGDVSSGPDGSVVPKQPRSIGFENAACVAAACDAFAKLAGDPKLPTDDLACAFAHAVAAFKQAMAPRDDVDDDDDDDFEKVAAATRAFHATLDRGVPAAQKYVSAAGGVDALGRSWGDIADAFEASVLGVARVGEKNEGAAAASTKTSQRRRRERDALRREGLAALRDACARGDSAPEEVIARLVQVLTAGADAEIIDDFGDRAADDETVARDAEHAFPSLCLARLRDLALSAGSGSGASFAARLAAPALLDKCESSLRRHAAEESLSVRGPKQTNDKDVYSFAVSAARASFAASALKAALAPAINSAGAGSVGGFFFRKETPATILAAAATPERSRAVRAALEACAVSRDAALRDAAGKTLEAFSRFEETRAA